MSDHERSEDPVETSRGARRRGTATPVALPGDADATAVGPGDGAGATAAGPGNGVAAEFPAAPARSRREDDPDGSGGRGGVVEVSAPPAAEDPGAPPPMRPKIKWLRLIGVLSGLGLLALVSSLFGMMMAVASDLPRIDVLEVAETPSDIVDRRGNRLGVLTGNENRILVQSEDIAPVMKHAIVAIEDRRFYTNSGVDLRAIARALYQDVVAQRVVQGGSTIAQQLVKNRLEAQSDRTILQKAREAAVAFHMTRKWDKQKILTNYLNTVYFGNGAYGIEAAAKTYFGTQHAGCGQDGRRRCAEVLEPHEAALLAGAIASPSGYDPIANSDQARSRRNLVLLRMLEQGYLTRPQYDAAVAEPVPTKNDIVPPREESRYPYFTTWVRQQVVDQVGPSAAFEGGLRVDTTIDPDLQRAAEDAVRRWIGFNDAGPAAGVVALDNRTSEVLALVGGNPDGFNARPFNLATQGRRQPGSAFKPFVLAEALKRGFRADTVVASKKKTFCVQRRRGKCREWFEVNNYEDEYAGVTNLARATTFSDNSVYAEVGIKVGTKRIARLARRMGVRTNVSTNPAITLGGLRQGVTVIDMAHAYQTFARHGKLVFGSLSPGRFSHDVRRPVPGPVGIRRIREKGRDEPARLLSGESAVNRTETKQVLDEGVAKQVESMLTGVVKFGTGKRASLGPDVMVAGKTGTTEDYGDAWFVGWTKEYTVAVWVGFPNETRPMEPPLFSFQGEPVAGGTYPAAIWHDFMKRALEILDERNPERKEKRADSIPDASSTGVPDPGAAPAGAAAPDASAAPAPGDRRRDRSGTRERSAPEREPEQPSTAPPPPGTGGGTEAPSGGTAPPDGDSTTPESPAAPEG